MALTSSETGALIDGVPIVGSLPDGAVVVDVTVTFSNDIAAATDRTVLGKVGAVPAAAVSKLSDKDGPLRGPSVRLGGVPGWGRQC